MSRFGSQFQSSLHLEEARDGQNTEILLKQQKRHDQERERERERERQACETDTMSLLQLLERMAKARTITSNVDAHKGQQSEQREQSELSNQRTSNGGEADFKERRLHSFGFSENYVLIPFERVPAIARDLHSRNGNHLFLKGNAHQSRRARL